MKCQHYYETSKNKNVEVIEHCGVVISTKDIGLVDAALNAAGLTMLTQPQINSVTPRMQRWNACLRVLFSLGAIAFATGSS